MVNKAVLIIDMPECCADCPLQTEYDTLRCAVNDEVTNMKSTRPDWCPLMNMRDKDGYDMSILDERHREY